MLNPVWMATIFGPFLMILAIWMLFYQENVAKVLTSIKNAPGLMYLMGVINLLLGLGILSQYCSWMWGLPVLLTLLGWVLLIRGVLAFFIPQFLVHKKAMNSTYTRLKAMILLVWGFGLCWYAFGM